MLSDHAKKTVSNGTAVSVQLPYQENGRRGLKSALFRAYTKQKLFSMSAYNNAQLFILILMAFAFLYVLDLKITQVEMKNAKRMAKKTQPDDNILVVQQPILVPDQTTLEADLNDDYEVVNVVNKRAVVDNLESQERPNNKKPKLMSGKKRSIAGKANFAHEVDQVERGLWRTRMRSDPQCDLLELSYAPPETLPTVMLASHDGGGAHWARRLLETISGIFCGIDDKQKQMELELGLGSGYDVDDKKRDDTNHDVDDGTQLATQTFRGYDRFHSTAILLLRNPFEAFVAAKAETDGQLDEAVISGPHWETDVRQRTYTWMARAKTWICAADKLHVMHFERLRKDLHNELTSALRFLNRPEEDRRLSCATKYGSEAVDALDSVVEQRQSKLRFPYGGTHVRTIELAICTVNELLQQKGYEPLPLAQYLTSMNQHFQGLYLPNTLCEDSSQYSTINC